VGGRSRERFQEKRPREGRRGKKGWVMRVFRYELVDKTHSARKNP